MDILTEIVGPLSNLAHLRFEVINSPKYFMELVYGLLSTSSRTKPSAYLMLVMECVLLIAILKSTLDVTWLK